MIQRSSRRRFLMTVAAGAFAALPFGAGFAAEMPLVAITSIIDHPALNAVRDGVKDELKAQGFGEDKVRVVFQNAQGQPATAAQIARKFVGDKAAVIVAISTPSAQAAQAATRDIPIVFSAVTDPVSAKLVDSAEKPGGNVTGVSDRAPIGEQLDLIREMTPNAKTIGIVFNPGEANSAAIVTLFKEMATSKGFKVVEGPATRSADISTATRSLVGKVDVIYAPTDNTVISAFEAVSVVATGAKIPLYAGDTDSVARGAFASLGFNYYGLGRQTGDQVVHLLKGEKVGALPVVYAKGSDLVVSKKTAAAIGVTISNAVLNRAKKVLEEQ